MLWLLCQVCFEEFQITAYKLQPMKKINFSILLFLGFLTSLCNSNYDKYDNYKYDENYDYYDYTSEDYTNDYNQESNDYYGHHNLLTPAPSPPPPPPLPQPGNILVLFW